MSEKEPVIEDLRQALQALADSQREMEARLIREMRSFEQRIVLMFKLSQAMAEVEDLKSENEQLKREKTQSLEVRAIV